MINKDMTIVEALQTNPASSRVFQSYGMGCIHCQLAHHETIAEACVEHGIELEEMLTRLNEAV